MFPLPSAISRTCVLSTLPGLAGIMAYEPVGHTQDSRISINDDIEPRTRYDAGSYNSEPSATDSQYRGTDGGAKDTKDANWTSTEIISNEWPLQSRKLAPMTPMRGFVIIFDVVLASMPIMFIGGFCIASPHCFVY